MKNKKNNNKMNERNSLAYIISLLEDFMYKTRKEQIEILSELRKELRRYE